jgi:HPt (histidine-containing phosphotransfer) domain-containing protein
MEMEPGDAVFNEHDLLENVGEDEDFAAEMVRTFLECQPAMSETLLRALELRLPHEIERAAHSLKGALGTLGGFRAAGIAAGIESAAERGALDEAVLAAAPMDGELATLLQALSGYLSRRQAA